MQNPLDKNVLQKGTLLGLLFVLLFFVGVVVVYLLLTLSGLTDWNQATRIFVSLFVGPFVALTGIAIYRRNR